MTQHTDFYTRLGFQVGARNRHPWGTENRLIQFRSSFLELITVADAGQVPPHAHGFFSFGAYASHDFGRHLSAFAAGDNLFDRSIQAGKTPQLTLASPRTARFGLRINFGE